MIGIIGAGSWGTALALQASYNNQQTLLWEFDPSIAAQLQQDRENKTFLPGIHFPDNLAITDSLERCLNECSVLLIAVPSSAFRAVLEQLSGTITHEQGICWATKGLDQKHGQLLNQVVEQILGTDFPMAALSGPTFAAEVANKAPTGITLASCSPQLTKRIIGYLHGDNFRIYTSNDLTGVCLAGAYKNVLAIAAGISDGLELGHNARAAVITRGLSEMQRLGITLGGKTETFMGLAGLGDLVLTCTGDLSRNRRLGVELAKGDALDKIQQNIAQVTEGVETTRVIHKLAQTYHTDLPIAGEVYNVLFESASPVEAVRSLLSREPRQEFQATVG